MIVTQDVPRSVSVQHSASRRCSGFRVLTVLGCLATLSACGSFSSPNSPDVVYSETATEARALQVPPDLTDVSNAEQFVLPGTGNTAVTRNTLLPQFDTVRFVREGGQSWLEFQQAPEDLWPQLLAFVRTEKYRVEQTEPAAGVIVTQWRLVDSVASSNILRNLVGDDEQATRIAFRLERAGAGARLFARSQAGSAELVEATEQSGDALWPAQSHDPETTSAMLNRFLVFLGVEQQKARGILGDEQARAVLDDAVVLSTAAGSEMRINRGFQSSFAHVEAALKALDYDIVSVDSSVGSIVFMDEQTPLSMQISPIHISAARVALRNADGGSLPAEREVQLLKLLVGQMV